MMKTVSVFTEGFSRFLDKNGRILVVIHVAEDIKDREEAMSRLGRKLAQFLSKGEIQPSKFWHVGAVGPRALESARAIVRALQMSIRIKPPEEEAVIQELARDLGPDALGVAFTSQSLPAELACVSKSEWGSSTASFILVKRTTETEFDPFPITEAQAVTYLRLIATKMVSLMAE